MLSLATPGLSLLRPVIALNFWTFAMEAWMYATRIPAVSRYKVPTTDGVSKADFNARIPPNIQWKADNYNHLMEQPTQFYAVAITLALLGADDGLNVGLCWLYVGLRIVHSLVHATVNKIMLRFQLFAASSIVLVGLAVRAAVMLF
ncbi:hypothetical protein LTR66_001530 [Elasticomyces elasticus]|nr:hypothetical protein LTR28_009174 [Elasticomyces elasticus]KAK4999429.1 hypothetical protein LTR66_001530 [Elasticomyces elasticus]